MTRFQLVVPALLLAACGGGSTVVEPPPPPADEFTLTLRADAEDLTTVQTLGWSAGIPQTDVILTPKAPATGAAQTYRTSAVGTIIISRLAAGDYLVEARRMLTETERGRLAAGDDAVGFVAKRTVRVAVGGGAEVVSAPASRRRSLVISEFFNNYLYMIPTVYQLNAFVELYNNGDTTIYVDGMILARALAPDADYPNFPCALYAPATGDPGGVWARFMVKFPGSGREHPVLPGEAIVVATDAIDHSAIVSGGFDLRAARFEMSGPADVDNPTVPDMIEATAGGYTGLGHGQEWGGGSSLVTVLSMPVNLSALPRTQLPIGGPTFLRLPRAAILDVLAFHGKYVGAYPYCPQMVHPDFDRSMAFLFLSDEFALSGQRRAVPLVIGGRRIVQHTRNSDADFIAAPRSPGTIP